MKTTFRVAEISFGYSTWDASHKFEMDGNTFDVQRFGANYSVGAVKSLISQLQNEVDAFAMTSLPPTLCLGNQSFIHSQYLQIMNTPSSAPLCDGTGLREICNIQSLMRMIQDQSINTADGFFFPIALFNAEMAEFLRKQNRQCVSFGDLYTILGLPVVAAPFLGLMSLTKLGLNMASMMRITGGTDSPERQMQMLGETLIAPQIRHRKYIVADLSASMYFEKNRDFFNGKELIIWSKHKGMESALSNFGVQKIHSLLPKNLQAYPYMNYALYEACLRLTHNKSASLTFEEWQELLGTSNEVIQTVKKFSLPRRDSAQAKMTRVIQKTKSKLTKKKDPDYAFILHALSHKDFEQAPLLGPIIRALPPTLNDSFDRAISHMPPIVYGHIKHVVSEETGKEVNGIIYGLFATPKVLKSQDPELTYLQIQKCCEDAANRGAKIVGLGAYTKVVGDSGVTINKNSPLPVTTGNSLSASATLWGLHDVVRRMGLLKIDKNTGKLEGSAMVIGATGSIGKVSAKLLSLVFKRIYLVAPRMDRLLELAQEIRQGSPGCEVICTTDANEFAGQADALVTATSAVDKKIVDVMNLKPGCVVCDCSRPLDFTKEDVKKRPDVIVIESGELILPGPYEMTCSLGLPGKTVYACLAETCVLAMEEKYESFTLGRDIDHEKVKEIYRLSRKHGVKLANMQGHMGTLTDREIVLARELALSRLRRS